MKKYTIRQTFQCDNKWDEMSPQGNGRHCGSCNKIVVDFTEMSDQDIIQFLLKNTHSCGLFKKNQLNRTMIFHPVKKKRSHWPAIAAMLIAGTFAVVPNYASGTFQKTSIEFMKSNEVEVEPGKTNTSFPVQIFDASNNNLITWGSVYVDGLGTFSADYHGIINIKHEMDENKMPESFQVTVYAGGYLSKTFTFYTKDLKISTGAKIYLDQQTEEISPPGTVAIHEETSPQNQKK
jgi:hypothetical protein